MMKNDVTVKFVKQTWTVVKSPFLEKHQVCRLFTSLLVTVSPVRNVCSRSSQQIVCWCTTGPMVGLRCVTSWGFQFQRWEKAQSFGKCWENNTLQKQKPSFSVQSVKSMDKTNTNNGTLIVLQLFFVFLLDTTVKKTQICRLRRTFHTKTGSWTNWKSENERLRLCRHFDPRLGKKAPLELRCGKVVEKRPSKKIAVLTSEKWCGNLYQLIQLELRKRCHSVSDPLPVWKTISRFLGFVRQKLNRP